MEMTWQQWLLMKKNLRRKFGSIGWILLVYYLIMNVAVFLAVFVEAVIRTVIQMASGNTGGIQDAIYAASESPWGYYLAIAVGLLILLLWKKRGFWRDEIWAKGRPMKPGRFFAILCVFLSGQFVYQLGVTILEGNLNLFGYTIYEGLESLALGSDSLGFLIYAGILAPITEELLFRGLIQRTLMPYGKKFAILCSAFTFGIFHGNIIQAPYAFLVGLILGYVASEYSIAWAMLLHLINNLVIADMMTRLTGLLPTVAANLVTTMIILAFFAAGLIILIVKHKAIGNYLRREKINPTCLRCFFGSAGVITLMVVMAVSMVYTCYVLITPL